MIMKMKLIYFSLLIILLLLINKFLCQKREEFKDYYKDLTDSWKDMFPDGNRNSASSIFFKHIWLKKTIINSII